MLSRTLSIKARLMITLVAVVLVLIVAELATSGVPVATAKSECKKVKGEFTLQPIPAPDCASPTGLCAIGTYKGDIKGQSDFTGTSLTPTADTPATGVVLLTGDNIIHTDGGDLLTKDAIVLNTGGAGEFAEVDVITGGTGEWAGVTGLIQAVGTFTAAGGEGRYTGEICTP